MECCIDEYFSPSYRVARGRFLDAAAAAGFELESLCLPEKMGPDGEPLFIDIAFSRGSALRPGESPDALFLHSSGTHGVEGYIGSAIQLSLLAQAASGSRPELCPPARGMTVFIHAVNPFGFAWNRRFTASNCDLNRNWLVPARFVELAKQGVPALFERFRGLIAPDYVPDPDSWSEWLYVRASAGIAIAQCGLDALKEAVAAGHHSDPEAMYFGGAELCEEPRLIVAALRRIGALQEVAADAPGEPAEGEAVWQPWGASDAGGLFEGVRGPARLVSVDVHSGLGEAGQSSLLLSGTEGGEEAATIRRALGLAAHDAAAGPKSACVQDASALGSAGVAYTTRGGFSEALASVPGPAGLPVGAEPSPAAYSGVRPADRVCIAQEFGTVPTTDVFFALRAENALYQSDETAPPSHPLRQQLRAAFFPDDAAWRRECLAQGVTVAVGLAAHAFAGRD
ncbi:hypothetical protein FNF29_00538 [Cafeteria roenbergensis]|uniref:Peptidase M14 carboxypeptidase A domain-containing protein n=1 Tax=Cafeteria roenbergensis TaxID=33653 RepID=A0A5A8CVW4_CAFRO|nr:hypothetical protein FNF29_00538 [Cafeteria roenbergensis]|eukprot:KAA0157186.1 hypothetical protein FNF29_00538 [Cafeteria roenbergensis]